MSRAYVCRDFVGDITAYLEGALPADDIRAIDAHLADCPHCTRYLEQMRRTIADAGALAADAVDTMPADVRDRLLAAFAESRE